MTGQQGFSLVEILMAIFLSVVVISITVSNLGGDERSKLEDTLRKLERSVRFATDESILRNKLVRLQFALDEDPITYKIEYGQSANIVLPEAVDLESLNLRDRNAELKRIKKLDSQFVTVPEFEAGSEPLPESVVLYALGTTYYPDLMREGKVSIYFYPSGEKDNTIIFLHTPQELASLVIFPFEDRTQKEFYLFAETELDNIESTIENKTKEIFEQWLRK